MKEKLITLYVSLFTIFVFFASTFCAYDLIDMLNLPEGIISAIINYGYLLVHIVSFIAMFHFKDKLIKTEKGE